jgi:uncharacterized repeat protein (TIGR01451 family)
MPGPSAPRLSVTAAIDPEQPVAGDAATVTITVRNQGERTVQGLALTDEVSRTAALRSGSSPAGECRVSPGRAVCQLGDLAPGDSVTTEVRLQLEPEPVSPTVSQRITLSASGDRAQTTERAVSTLIDGGPGAEAQLLAIPGTTITVITFTAFVLASRPPSTTS